MGKLLYVSVIFKNKWAIVQPLHLNMKCLKSKRGWTRPHKLDKRRSYFDSYSKCLIITGLSYLSLMLIVRFSFI